MREIISEREGHHGGFRETEWVERGSSRRVPGILRRRRIEGHNFIYCACSSVKREPRCYIRAPPSVAIFQQKETCGETPSHRYEGTPSQHRHHSEGRSCRTRRSSSTRRARPGKRRAAGSAAKTAARGEEFGGPARGGAGRSACRGCGCGR